jgi:hypothetical protein
MIFAHLGVKTGHIGIMAVGAALDSDFTLLRGRDHVQ